MCRSLRWLAGATFGNWPAQPYHFVFFEHWQTDVIGHRGDLAAAIANFQRFDGFLAGLLAAADLNETLIIVSSDHGNVEDCSHGKHTENPVLTLLLGAQRQQAATHLRDLTDFAPLISLRFSPIINKSKYGLPTARTALDREHAVSLPHLPLPSPSHDFLIRLLLTL